MKKLLSVLLIVCCLLLAITACAPAEKADPIEEANAYLQRCEEEDGYGCFYMGNYERESRYSYVVTVTMPNVPAGYIHGDALKHTISNDVCAKIYPELEKILEDEEKVSHIVIFFENSNGSIYKTYADGQWVN